MPSARWLSIFPLLLLLCGCDDHALQQRTDEIRRLSDKEDRAYTAEALAHIERQYWTLRDHAWIGKLSDGTLIRLDSPHAAAAPLPSSAFYTGWHLQLTISSQDWRSYPASPAVAPFQVVYAITRHSATAWDIRVSEGSVTSPLLREDLPRLRE
jgi:hypothetical protein